MNATQDSGYFTPTQSGTSTPNNGRRRLRSYKRKLSMPFENATRHKPRRWPLVLRFTRGAIHVKILLPVFLHALFAALVVFIDQHLKFELGLPPSIVPSLSIVVGLMLVFRNQTSYSRFWEGRNFLTVIITSVRNLSRSFLACSYSSDPKKTYAHEDRAAERAETERIVRLLVALLFVTKNHLRADWGAYADMSSSLHPPFQRIIDEEFVDLIPQGLVAYENKGLGVLLQFTFLIEAYIKKGFERGWWHAPQASQLSVQVNNIVDSYGRMETIRLTPVPVALLIHQKQVLALFGAVLPFATVTDLGWLAVPITTLVVFTLYGIDGIASELEDPFGYDRTDISMDAIVEDIRAEVQVLLDEWRKVTEREGKDGRGEEPGDWFARDKRSLMPGAN